MRTIYSAITWIALLLCSSFSSQLVAQKVFTLANNGIRIHDFATGNWEQKPGLPVTNTNAKDYVLGFNPDQSILYAFKSQDSQSGSAKLFSVDPTTYTVTEEIDFGTNLYTSAPGSTLLFSTSGPNLYLQLAPGTGDSPLRILKINLSSKTYQVMETPATPDTEVRDLSLSPDGTVLAVLTNKGTELFQTFGGSYWFKLNTNSSYEDIALNRDGSLLYGITKGNEQEVLVYDLATDQQIARIPLQHKKSVLLAMVGTVQTTVDGYDLVVSADGKQLQVLIWHASFFSLDNIDLKNSKVTSSFLLEREPFLAGDYVFDCTLSQDGRQLTVRDMAPDGTARGVWVYNQSKPTEVKALLPSPMTNAGICGGLSCSGIAVLYETGASSTGGATTEVEPSAEYLTFLPSFEKDLVSVINPQTKELKTEIMMGDGPQSIAFDASGHRIYVANQLDGSISVINPGSRIVTETYPLNLPTGALVVNLLTDPTGAKVYVANVGVPGRSGRNFTPTFGSVSIIDATTFTEEKIENVYNPYDLVLSADEEELFVTNHYSSTVTRIDLPTQTINSATLSVGREPTGIALSPDGNKLAVANFASRNASLIDLTDNTTQTISTRLMRPSSMKDLFFNAAGTELTLFGGDQYSNHLVAYDLDNPSGSRRLLSSVPMFNVDMHPNGAKLVGMLASGNRMLNHFGDGLIEFYIAGEAPKKVYHLHRYDGSARAESFGHFIRNIPAPEPVPITTARAYLPNLQSSTVSVVDLGATAPKVMANIILPSYSSPVCSVVSPDGDRVYIAETGRNELLVIDPFTNQIVQKIRTGHSPTSLVLNADGSILYLLDYEDSQVEVLRTDNWALEASIPVGGSPMDIVLSPDGETLYVANFDTDDVSVIDTDTKQEVRKVRVGDQPEGLEISPAGDKVYVTNLGDGTLSVINTGTQTVSTTITGFGRPYDVCFHPSLDLAYLVDNNTQNIYVINTNTNTKASLELNTGRKLNGVSISATGDVLYVISDNGVAGVGALSVVPLDADGGFGSGVQTVSLGVLPLSKGNFVRRP